MAMYSSEKMKSLGGQVDFALTHTALSEKKNLKKHCFGIHCICLICTRMHFLSFQNQNFFERT
jgi:hypothetical protein